MNSFLVLCEHARKPKLRSQRLHYDKQLEVQRTGRSRNLQLAISNITHRIIEDLSPRAKDLVEIASYVYFSDSSFPRWSERDVFAEKWVRNFHFIVPVRDPKFWSLVKTKEALQSTLASLTGDNYKFEFEKLHPQSEQLFIEFEKNSSPSPSSADCICLFSGGLDSFAGVATLIRNGRKPLLVSHRSSPKIDARQRDLVKHMRELYPSWSFPHINVWVNRRGDSAVEQTQRSRSFLFLSLASAISSQLGLPDIFLCENGTVTFNIPLSGQNVGSMLSRSTHPSFVQAFSELHQLLFSLPANITNPFIFMTRAEVARSIVGTCFDSLIRSTISCAHILQASTLHPHCGTCSQCVDRRFAFAASDIASFDNIDSYEKDIFLHELGEGEERTLSENYVRAAYKIERLNDSSFFEEYPELMECFSAFSQPANVVAESIFGLYKRHSKEVINVVEAKVKEHLPDYLRNRLPQHCLVSMIAHNQHSIDPKLTYPIKLGDLFERTLRIAFQKRKPRNERDVQDQIESTLSSSRELLNREGPFKYYSMVQTKPDFSTKDDRLFIEVKFIADRKKVNSIITEMTSRTLIYRDQGASVLFFVYDANNIISDHDKFACDFTKHEGIFVKIAK